MILHAFVRLTNDVHTLKKNRSIFNCLEQMKIP